MQTQRKRAERPVGTPSREPASIRAEPPSRWPVCGWCEAARQTRCSRRGARIFRILQPIRRISLRWRIPYPRLREILGHQGHALRQLDFAVRVSIPSARSQRYRTSLVQDRGPERCLALAFRLPGALKTESIAHTDNVRRLSWDSARLLA